MIAGGGGDDVIAANAGNDHVDGGAGNDTIDGAAGNDRLTGAAGDDQITGDDGNDNIDGGAGNDHLIGGAGNDLIQGGDGNDVIQGGAERDSLSGGAGADTFVFSAAPESPYGSNPDVITDFVSGTDKIDLSALHLASTSQISIVTNGGNTYVIVDVNNDGTPDMLIEALGASAVKLSDIATGIAPMAAHSVAPETPAHHDLIAFLHAVAVDHGLHG